MSKEIPLTFTEKSRVLLSAAQLVVIIGFTWTIAHYFSKLDYSIQKLSDGFTQLKTDAAADRSEIRAMGERLVQAVNRITAIESRTTR